MDTGSYTVESAKGIGGNEEASLTGGEQVAFDGGAMFGSHPKDIYG
jgi:hypothetical protein